MLRCAILAWLTLASLAAGKESMKVASPGFADGRPLPAKYTCAGADISPALQWEHAPAGTKSFVLICDDPDAPGGSWIHWIIYDVPGNLEGLPEHIAPAETLPNGAMQGLNSFRKVGYNGPCPPPGGPHRYFFKLYALDTPLHLKPRATRPELLQAMRGHVLAEAQTMGTHAAR